MYEDEEVESVAGSADVDPQSLLADGAEKQVEPVPAVPGSYPNVPTDADACVAVWVDRGFFPTGRARDEYQITPTHAILVTRGRIYGCRDEDLQDVLAFWKDKVQGIATIGVDRQWRPWQS